MAHNPNIEKIQTYLSDYIPNKSGVKRSAAVLIPLVLVDDKLHVLYQKRALHLKSQPGEICFPGGKNETSERSSDTALRETCEELNLSEDQVTLFGQIDSILTSFDMIIHCYVGFIHCPIDQITFSRSEVSELFTIPLEELLNLPYESFAIKNQFILPDDFPFSNIPNGKDYNFKNTSYPVVFYHYKEWIIWGLTARMTQHFVQVLLDKGITV